MSSFSWEEVVTVAGTGATAAEVRLTKARAYGQISAVLSRLATAAAVTVDAVVEVNRRVAGAAVVYDDRYYQSGTPAGTDTTFTPSATEADIKDVFLQPTDFATGLGVPPYVRVVPAAGTVGAWSFRITVRGRTP